MTSLTALIGAQIHHYLCMNIPHMGIFKGLVAALTGANRISRHRFTRSYSMPTMTVRTGRNPRFVFNLQMAWIVHCAGDVALFTILGNVGAKLLQVLRWIRFMGKTIPSSPGVTINAIDLLRRVHAMDRLL
jgi:hypothetical protein